VPLLGSPQQAASLRLRIHRQRRNASGPSPATARRNRTVASMEAVGGAAGLARRAGHRRDQLPGVAARSWSAEERRERPGRGGSPAGAAEACCAGRSPCAVVAAEDTTAELAGTPGPGNGMTSPSELAHQRGPLLRPDQWRVRHKMGVEEGSAAGGFWPGHPLRAKLFASRKTRSGRMP